MPMKATLQKIIQRILTGEEEESLNQENIGKNTVHETNICPKEN